MGSVAMEEYELMKDSKYRIYVSAVDRALKYFESTNEWPDLISALGKLNKVLRDNQRFPVIPRRIKISKRLAQCMHFALPSGVHLKALETYDTIFKCMGTNRLSHELFIYSAGLFPLFGNSAMNVKPPLLTVYETHFVPLGPRLRPGLSGFLSGVLPGLEEGSDHFDRTNTLLEKVCEGVGPTYFYGCLWECVSCNSAIRLPAISFVLSHFNKKLIMEDQMYLMGTDINIMVNAICAGVQDTNVLVQRSSLDLLLVGFPMHNKHLSKTDMVSLVTAALSTILRRDMSLNRRLYAWFLGSEINASLLSPNHPFVKKMEESCDVTQTALYFDMYSKDYLIEGIKAALSQQNSSSPDIRPYRLLMSLLDKPDVGPVILDDIFFEVFRTLFLACSEEKCEGAKQKQEILKSANLLFSSFEPWYIWQYTSSLFDQACKMNIEELTTISEIEYTSVVVKPVGSGFPNVWEVCELCEFLLNVIPLETCADTPSEHLLNLASHLVLQLTKYVDTLSQEQIARSLKLCTVILSKIRPLLICRKISRAESTSAESSRHSESEFVNPALIRSRVGSDNSLVKTVEEPKRLSIVETEHPETNNNVPTILKNFLKSYEIFYVTLVGSGRIIQSTMVPEAFEKLRKKSDCKSENEKDYASELRRILTAVMNDDDTTEIFYRKKDVSDGLENLPEVTLDGNEKWEDSFRIASEILVELSSFPRGCIYDINPEDKTVFSPWIKILVVCACSLEKSPKLQLIAMRTLLDLLSWAKSEGSIVALLNSSHANYLEQNTNVVKIIARTLWRHLGNLPSDLQVIAIELIYLLHNTISSGDTVERVLGEALLRGTGNGRVDALQRFTKLWHVGRELQTKETRHKKLFQRCSLKLLDNLLLSDNSPLKIETQTWLVQSLMRGDIARLLDPILLMLLDPATARMSILHVSIQHSGGDSREAISQAEDSYSKIYAISSVDGNVIYHVSNSLTEKGNFHKRLKWRWKKENDNNNQRIFAITSLKNQGDNRHCYVTEKNVMRDIELPRTCNSNISVFVNPFARRFPEDESCEDEKSESDYDFTKNAKRFNSLTKNLDLNNETNIEMDLLPRQPKITLEVTTTESPPVEVKFFNHLKNKLMDADHGDCEESLSADEYFNPNKKETSEATLEIVKEVLDDLIDNVVKKCEGDEKESNSKPGVGVHPYHSHLLLYCGVYDSCRTLYAFNTLKNILLTNSRLFLCCAATSGIVNAPFSSELLILLARHRKSVFGRSFHGDVSSLTEYVSIYRSNMYLEILVSICLHFARSYYPNLGLLRLTAEEIAGNRQVQLTSLEVLTYLFNELIPIVRDSGKGFANYIADLLNRCKVQKIILHCTMSSIHNIQQQQLQQQQPQPTQPQSPPSDTKTFTEEILDFNDPHLNKKTANHRLTEHSEAMQIQLLKLLQSLIMLEQQVDNQKLDSSDLSSAKEGNSFNSSQESKYSPGCLIPQQPMFLKAVMTALKMKGQMRWLHYNWTELITASLPYLSAALPQVIMITINQLCSNVEELATVYSSRKCNKEECLPADYAITQLEALTVLCHFCVLDSNQQVSPQPLASAAGSNLTGMPGSNPGQILSNLVHVFTPTPLSQDQGKEKNQQMETFLNVRRSVLGNMPRIISSVAALWHAITDLPNCDTDICVWGNPRVVKNQILEFLSPISLHHGANFLAAIAVAWQERKSTDDVKKVLPVASRSQQVLVNLVSAIRVMPIDTLVQTVHVVVKQPPSIHGASQDVSLDVSVLELFYVYMQTSTGIQLGESWTSLLGLLRDGLILAPPALFLVLAILNEFVQKCPPFQDKKDQRDLQDITAKLIEACGTVAGACLEQKTWLGRNLSVKEDIDDDEDESTQSQTSSLQQHSVHAQLVFAQILAPLLDVSYGSQEKEKVAALLTNLMYNITPYLRNHMLKNAPSFQACSQLLANLSGFQYTRKAWKRDVFELLLEPSLFQMEMECLKYWTTIIDNLMTHDMTTFRDLMSKISVAQSGSYSLFSSREQEYEQRSQLLKRLAFIIFCSETDQYHKFMPNIQERLSESLRLPQVVPSVQAQVFLCFRVLLLRMSSHHVTSLWPIIISEMVQVFTHIEQELTTDTEEFSSHIKNMSALDSSWVVNSSNGLHAHGHPHWLQLTLAAAKLLDLAVLLPAQHLPQFQMYRWAFVSDPLTVTPATQEEEALNCHDFVPHVKRISKLMEAKYGPVVTPIARKDGYLMLEMTQIDALQQLHPFFTSLGLRQSSTVDMEALEKSILNDFLEKMQSKTNHT